MAACVFFAGRVFRKLGLRCEIGENTGEVVAAGAVDRPTVKRLGNRPGYHLRTIAVPPRVRQFFESNTHHEIQ